MHTINIFLASSLKLQQERDALQKYLSGTELNDLLYEDNVRVNLIRCEDVSYGFKRKRLQTVLNEKLKESQLSIFIFENEINKGTEEEFDVAYNEARKRAKNNAGHTMFVYYFGDNDVDNEIQRISKGNIYAKKCKNIYMVESVFILDLLKYVREQQVLYGERYRYSRNLDNSKLNNFELYNYKEEGEKYFGKYKWHQERQNSLKFEIHNTINHILQKIKLLKTMSAVEKLEVYSNIYTWADETEYKNEEHCKLMIEYAMLLTQTKQYDDAREVLRALIPLVDELYEKITNNKQKLSESYCSIGEIFYQMEEMIEALVYYEKAFSIQRTIYGDDDLVTQKTKTRIENIRAEHSKSAGGQKDIMVNNNFTDFP